MIFYFCCTTSVRMLIVRKRACTREALRMDVRRYTKPGLIYVYIYIVSLSVKFIILLNVSFEVFVDMNRVKSVTSKTY